MELEPEPLAKYPSDEIRTQEWTVFDVAFETFLQSFAEHKEGDRDAQGRCTDGGFIVSLRHGYVLQGGLRFKSPNCRYKLPDAGTRHQAAADTADHLHRLLLARGRGAGAVFVRSEMGRVTIFPSADWAFGEAWVLHDSKY